MSCNSSSSPRPEFSLYVRLVDESGITSEFSVESIAGPGESLGRRPSSSRRAVTLVLALLFFFFGFFIFIVEGSA